MSPVDELARGLERYLQANGVADLPATGIELAEVRLASAGARRHNVLFTATSGGRRVELVATIIPTTDLQIIDIEIEAANLRFAEGAGVPVPHVHAVCTDERWVGGPFFVSSQVAGETVPRQVLRLVEADPALGPRLAAQCGEAMARLHLADPAAAHPDLPAPGDAGSVRATLDGLRAQMDLLLQPSAPFELGFRWLVDHAPDDERVAMTHGDLRNGNLIVGADGLRAVLDWEASRLGAPMSDPAWMCVRMWRFRNDHLEVGGFATRDELRAGYEAAGGTWDHHAFHWWKVLGSLRWGIGLANQARQHLEGEFRSIVMAASGRRIAELEHDLLMLLAGEYG